MKTFNTFQELMDYVPNCIICGKQLELFLRGKLRGDPIDKQLNFHLKIKNGNIIGKNKNYSFTINPIDNQIIDGQEVVSNLLGNWFMFVSKKCSTCHCIINTQHCVNIKNYMISNYKKLPPLTLKNEEIFYTRKREKATSIYQRYNDNGVLIQSIISINYKKINIPYINLNHFKTLDHLNERLSTILTFS
jgi:hypothetical protein